MELSRQYASKESHDSNDASEKCMILSLAYYLILCRIAHDEQPG